MEKIYEVLDSITKRLGNPFLLSFGLSWLVSNWKAVVVIASNDTYEKKFNFLECLYAVETEPIWRLLWWPLIASAVYVFFIPLLGAIATGTSALYDNLNEFIRTKALRLRVLSLADSQALEARLQETINKLKNEADAASMAYVGRHTAASDDINRAVVRLVPMVFAHLRQEEPTWPQPREIMPASRSTSGVPEQEDFLRQFGLPKQWLEIFNPVHKMQSLSVKRAALIYQIEEDEAMDWLLRLTAAGMLRITWVDRQYMFDLYGGNWGAALNGRPA